VFPKKEWSGDSKSNLELQTSRRSDDNSDEDKDEQEDYMNNPLADYAADRFQDSMVPNKPGNSYSHTYQSNNRGTMGQSMSGTNPLLANTNFGNTGARQQGGQSYAGNGGHGTTSTPAYGGGYRNNNMAVSQNMPVSQNRAPMSYSTTAGQPGTRVTGGMGHSQQGTGVAWSNNRDTNGRGANPLTPLSFTYS